MIGIDDNTSKNIVKKLKWSRKSKIQLLKQDQKLKYGIDDLNFFFSSRRRHTRWTGDWSSDVCSSDLYVFTPLTAAGQEGSPTGFFTNTRYLMPGLVLAMALLPLARPIRAPDRRAWQTLLFLTGVFAITVLTTQIGRASCRERV